MQVGDGRDASRGDNRRGQCESQIGGRFDIDASHSAVAVDIGIDDGGHAAILVAKCQIQRPNGGRFGPTRHRDIAFARINAHRDLARKKPAGLFDQLGLMKRDSAQDHSANAARQPIFHGLKRADAATQLDRNGNGSQNLIHGIAINRMPGKSAVQVNQMQPVVSLRLEGAGLVAGADVEYGGMIHHATDQPDAGAVFKIDGGVKNHSG